MKNQDGQPVVLDNRVLFGDSLSILNFQRVQNNAPGQYMSYITASSTTGSYSSSVNAFIDGISIFDIGANLLSCAIDNVQKVCGPLELHVSP